MVNKSLDELIIELANDPDSPWSLTPFDRYIKFTGYNFSLIVTVTDPVFVTYDGQDFKLGWRARRAIRRVHKRLRAEHSLLITKRRKQVFEKLKRLITRRLEDWN